MKFETHKFNLGFGLLAFGILVLVLFSGGLMFYTHDVKNGLSILSHIGAAVAGLMSGLGWKKYKQQEGESKGQ